MTLNSRLRPATADRVPRSLALCTQETGSNAFVPEPAQVDNGDEARYGDSDTIYPDSPGRA